MPCAVNNPAAAAAADNAPRPRKKAVLPQICALALAGQSCRQLAATFGLTKSTVGRWLQELREGCPTRVAGAAEIIAHAVARYDVLYRKALETWDLSQADKQTESVVEFETARGPKKKRTTRTESQVGAPVFLAEARRALDGIARIVARIAPRPGKVGVTSLTRRVSMALAPDITAERDGCVAVPRRPGKVATPDEKLSHGRPEVRGQRPEVRAQSSRCGCRGMVGSLARELSHPEAIAGGTVERAEYVGVPPRPGTNAAAPTLSHSVVNAGDQTPPSVPAQQDGISVNVPKCPIRETPRTTTDPQRTGVGQAATARLDKKQHPKERKPLIPASFSALQPRPLVDMSSLIRGVPRRQNSESGFECPISIAAPRAGAGRSSGRRKSRRPEQACAVPAAVCAGGGGG